MPPTPTSKRRSLPTMHSRNCAIQVMASRRRRGCGCDLVEGQGFSVVAREQFGKELAFAPWVERMRCAPNVISQLENILTDGASDLRTFLQPRRDNGGALHFTLQELLLVAEKPA